jgi:hypothetical protein
MDYHRTTPQPPAPPARSVRAACGTADGRLVEASAQDECDEHHEDQIDTSLTATPPVPLRP